MLGRGSEGSADCQGGLLSTEGSGGYLEDPLIVSDGSHNNHGLALPVLGLHLAGNPGQGDGRSVLPGHEQPPQDHLHGRREVLVGSPEHKGGGVSGVWGGKEHSNGSSEVG